MQSNKQIIDLRSDTVTRPTPEMLEVMAGAEVGDDMFGEDPTVNRLQEKVAEILGKEEALFVPSGTMGNQIAIHCLTQPGDEVICDEGSHFLHFETGGMAALSGVQPRTVKGRNGIMAVEQIEQAIRPNAHYFSTSKLITIENTHNIAGGTVWALEKIKQIQTFAAQQNLAMHLDGARLWNACAASGVSPKEYAEMFDSVSVCFSKGLGAPVGSAVAGSREFITQARRVRKMFGGAMRQAGFLAAAAIYALENNRERLQQDHIHAYSLAERLAQMSNLKIDLSTIQTNIVMIDLSQSDLDSTSAVGLLKQQEVLVVPLGPRMLRAVTHLHISSQSVERAVSAFKGVFK